MDGLIIIRIFIIMLIVCISEVYKKSPEKEQMIAALFGAVCVQNLSPFSVAVEEAAYIPRL